MEKLKIHDVVVIQEAGDLLGRIGVIVDCAICGMYIVEYIYGVGRYFLGSSLFKIGEL